MTSTPTLGAKVPPLGGLDDVETARKLDAAGYETLWVGELWSGDAFVRLTRMADAVESAALGTAIVNVFSRSPAALAGAAATLDQTAPNGVRLGIGTSTPKAIEDLHGMPFDRPIRRVHETAEIVREFTSGEGRVNYEGELFELADFPALDADVAIDVASLGASNRRATGRVGDGWLPHNIPFSHLEDAFETIADTAEEAGRDPGDIRTMPYVPSVVSDDPEAATAAVRGHVAYYVGSGEGYRRAVARKFPDEADEIAEAWRSGDRESARAAVTDEMVADLGVAGTAEEAREKLAEVAANPVIDEPIVVVPDSADAETAARTLEALAPDAF
jgi:alkanesulfonate monooxygenase SsuD/methylene tetrahydromethanopterin reductase-like flavin-dependent oxidoreductase (luciferase family)